MNNQQVWTAATVFFLCFFKKFLFVNKIKVLKAKNN